MFSRSPKIQTKPQGHQQLTSDTADEKDQIIGGLQFTIRYVGSTEVAGYNGTGSGKTETVVSKVFEQKNLKTTKKMIMTVCSTSVSLCEETSGKCVANFPISCITYCNTDKVWERAFVFVARQKKEVPFKAFIFQCESKQKALELFKALSLAFTINYECVQAKRIQEARSVRSCDTKTTATSTTGKVACSTDYDLVDNETNGKLASEKAKIKQSTRSNGVKIPLHMYVPKMDGSNNPTISPSSLQHSDGRTRSKTVPLPDYLYSNDHSAESASLPNNIHCCSTMDRPLLKNHENEDDEFAQFVQQRSRSTSDIPRPTLWQ